MGEYLKTVDVEWFKHRLTGAMACILAAFIVLFIRLIDLQVMRGEEYRRLSESNCIRIQCIDPPRGLIYDRNGRLLVDNRPAFDLSIVPKNAGNMETTIGKLSGYLGVPQEELLNKIRSAKGIPAYRPVLLKPDIARDVLAVVEAHRYDLPGVLVEVTSRRHYVDDQVAAHLIGYLGEINQRELKSLEYSGCKAGSYVGKFGVERIFESFLRGIPGGQQVEVDAAGQVVRVLNTAEAKVGQNIHLTIDFELQRTVQGLLSGIAGAAAAMDPVTGEVLALASSPTFDQNIFVKGMSHETWESLISNPQRPLENKAIQGEYPPASTYKIVTAIAGLEEKVIDADTHLFCPGYYTVGNHVFRCWKRGGHGQVNLNRALAESCDVYFYQVGQKLGVDRLARYAKGCGLGEATGIDLDHEARGLIPTAEWKKRRFGSSWQGGETLSIAIGQGYNLVTPLQMAALVSAMANGGTRYKPVILQRIEDADGRVVKTGESHKIGKIPAGRHNLDLVRKGLWEVVNGKRGTAKGIRLEGIDISGKTGTAQVVGRRKDVPGRKEQLADHLKDHAWFVAYAAGAENSIAVSVLVEHGEHGSSAAAPIAREIIRSYLGEKGEIPAPTGPKNLSAARWERR